MSAEPTVYVVDDDPAVHQSMRWLLESVGLKVLTFGSAGDFLERYPPGAPGCIVLDVRMPGMGGLELQAELRRRGIDLPVIIVSGHGDIPIAVRAMKAGAVDFVEKPVNDQQLIDCVQNALSLEASQRPRLEELRRLEERAGRLSVREREVMGWIVDGHPNKRIAAELGLSEKTIEVHRSNLMKKLGVRSIAELVRAALALEQLRENP